MTEIETLLAGPLDESFLDELEDAWKGHWLYLGDTYKGMPEGAAIMQAAYDYASAADPEGTKRWLAGLTVDLLD